MSEEEYEYFVCYYEGGGEDFAQRIYDTFTKARGYKVFVNHVYRDKYSGRLRDKIDSIIRKCKVFILINSYDALSREEVIREFKTGFSQGRMMHDLWIVCEKRDDVPRVTPDFHSKTSMDISQFEQNDFGFLGGSNS